MTTHGRLLRVGASAAGPWLELADPVAASAPPLLLVLPVAVAPGTLESMTGEDLELGLQIEGAMILEDGRGALRATPSQILTAMRPVESGRAMPEELSRQLGEISREVSKTHAEMFHDPGLTRSLTTNVRQTFLDRDLKKPFWSIAGPATIEPSDAGYILRSTSRAEDGGQRESVCRFRIEDGKLRSTAYEEILRDPGGKIVSREALDFVSGSAMDKISGKTFPWPKNIYAAPCLSFVFQGFPFMDKAAVSFFLWSDYDSFTTMYALLDGRETVNVPAGTFDCFRVRMNVNTEHIIRNLELPMPQAYDMARDIAGQMKPSDSVFWYSVEPPHIFVRMEGPMGPPGTSRALVERR